MLRGFGNSIFPRMVKKLEVGSQMIYVGYISRQRLKIMLSHSKSGRLRGRMEHWACKITMTLLTNRKGELSALSSKKFLGTKLLQSLSRPQNYGMRTETISRFNTSKQPNANRT